MQLKLNNLMVLRFSSVSLSCMEVRSITMDAKCFGLVHQTPAILGVSISSFLHIQVCMLLVPGGLGQLSLGVLVTNRDACVTCHTRHTSVTDFRPKSGNPVEVTLVTSPKLYIVSHAKGTDFP